MKAEAIKDFFTMNGQILSTREKAIFQAIEKPPIYEVIRIIEGLPLFLEDHLARMRKSAEIVGFHIERQDGDIKKDIGKLVEKNQVKNLNIKLISSEIEGMGQVFLVYFIESFYPPREYYEKGIHTILYNHQRPNPNAKIQVADFRAKIRKELDEEGAFEALLVNDQGFIPEGSRSNIFFVKEGKVYTSPKGAVLMGITRKIILQLCDELGIDLLEKNIHTKDLAGLDGAFMTGTSVGVLPIATIGQEKLNSVGNGPINKIKRAYENKVFN